MQELLGSQVWSLHGCQAECRPLGSAAFECSGKESENGKLFLGIRRGIDHQVTASTLESLYLSTMS